MPPPVLPAADSLMPGGLAAQIIIAILNEEMNMPAGAVWLREQNRTIPNDNGLYIAVGLVSAQTMVNVTEIQTISSVQYEINQLKQQEAIQIDILSSAASNLAMFRQWEIVAALQSIYAQQQQEINNCKIFRIPRNFIDTSSAEGGSMLQRYSITVIAHAWYRKQKALGTWYDDFNVQVSTETADPAFEFEVDSTTPAPPYP